MNHICVSPSTTPSLLSLRLSFFFSPHPLQITVSQSHFSLPPCLLPPFPSFSQVLFFLTLSSPLPPQAQAGSSGGADTSVQAAQGLVWLIMVLTPCLTLDQPWGCSAGWTWKHWVSFYKIKKINKKHRKNRGLNDSGNLWATGDQHWEERTSTLFKC